MSAAAAATETKLSSKQRVVIENKTYSFSVSTDDEPLTVFKKFSAARDRIERLYLVDRSKSLARLCNYTELGRFWAAMHATMNIEYRGCKSMVDLLFIVACFIEVAAHPDLTLEGDVKKLNAQTLLNRVKSLNTATDRKTVQQCFSECAALMVVKWFEDDMMSDLIDQVVVDEDELLLQMNLAESAGEEHKLTTAMKEHKYKNKKAEELDNAGVEMVKREIVAWNLSQTVLPMMSRAFLSLWYNEWLVTDAFETKTANAFTPSTAQRRRLDTSESELLPFVNTDGFKNEMLTSVQLQELPMGAHLFSLRQPELTTGGSIPEMVLTLVNPRRANALRKLVRDSHPKELLLESKETDQLTRDFVRLHLFRIGIEMVVDHLTFLDSFVLFSADIVEHSSKLFASTDAGQPRLPLLVQNGTTFLVHHDGKYCFNGRVGDALLVWCNIVNSEFKGELTRPNIDIREAWLSKFVDVKQNE